MATYENAMLAIQGLKSKFGGSNLFGNEKDGSFKSSIGQIYQTFGWGGSLSLGRGKSGYASLSGYKKSFVQRW